MGVRRPPSWQVAPPGPYWLTVRDSDGTPSVGHLIYIN
ncbi:MAG: DUF1929 domain-containing protein [Planctomycetes bacterium]|nr:DUF1929 domain-containing protein [Planctomycetota bacterium]MCC7169015.1 DUF1929 domain-containing protein [Planctomycetota bacterium]